MISLTNNNSPFQQPNVCVLPQQLLLLLIEIFLKMKYLFFSPILFVRFRIRSTFSLVTEKLSSLFETTIEPYSTELFREERSLPECCRSKNYILLNASKI